MDKLERWRGIVPDADLATYRKGGFGQAIGMGQRVALLSIDTTNNFTDPAYAMCAARNAPLETALARVTAAACA